MIPIIVSSPIRVLTFPLISLFSPIFLKNNHICCSYKEAFQNMIACTY